MHCAVSIASHQVITARERERDDSDVFTRKESYTGQRNKERDKGRDVGM